MFKDMPKELKKEIRSRLLSIATTLLFLFVMTWFWFGPQKELREAQTMMSNYQNALALKEENSGIVLENAIPVADETGSRVEPYQFTVTNESTKPLKIGLYFMNDREAILKDGCEVLDNNYIRYTIAQDDVNYSKPRNLNVDGLMYVDTLEANEQRTYQLKFWLDESSGNEIMGKHFHAKVTASEVPTLLVASN